MKTTFFPKLNETVALLSSGNITEERLAILQSLIDYVQGKIDQRAPIRLNFICTHNSRRSQFSQIWAQTAADHFGIPVSCYSGGVEVTAFNERAVASIRRMGFDVSHTGEGNPIYTVKHSAGHNGITAFSKLFDDPANENSGFAAVMTCSHADENCPFIPGAEARLPVRYEDPKAFDSTPLEAEKYDERAIQIATEMFYVFSQIKV